MEKPEKSGKREVAVAFAVFVAAFFVWGAVGDDDKIIDIAKYLTPFAVGGLSAAFGAQFYLQKR